MILSLSYSFCFFRSSTRFNTHFYNNFVSSLLQIKEN